MGNEYEVVGEYTKARNKIAIKHISCGTIWGATPNNFLKEKGTRCPTCFGDSLKTHEQFCKEVYKLVGDEYSIIDKYINAKTKIHFIHNDCNSIIHISPHKFLSGTRCPICNMSKNEFKIKEWLINNNIKFIQQYEFIDCGDKKPFPFDFAIMDKYNNLYCLIEYDGEFHFRPIKGKQRLQIQQDHDKIKTEYCVKNNIPLIRIPFWESEKIEEILKLKLKDIMEV